MQHSPMNEKTAESREANSEEFNPTERRKQLVRCQALFIGQQVLGVLEHAAGKTPCNGLKLHQLLRAHGRARPPAVLQAPVIAKQFLDQEHLTCSLGEESTSLGANREAYGPIMVNASKFSHSSKGLHLFFSPTVGKFQDHNSGCTLEH
ncbi:hypothetical protein EYF80_014100 [Liparis tanakae]|uniref:Uncharacterized protein n=1 Tax=Liparis tanakae TaxID=230148 RepID=A0A4Z2ICW4_9TELE|nr:hypothetical protein EYF80_014100 [Liparis tanakae]